MSSSAQSQKDSTPGDGRIEPASHNTNFNFSLDPNVNKRSRDSMENSEEYDHMVSEEDIDDEEMNDEEDDMNDDDGGKGCFKFQNFELQIASNS
jgi:hypothetical protein